METDSGRVVINLIISICYIENLKKNLHGCEHAHTYNITGELVIRAAHTIYVLLTAEENNFTIRENSCMV